MLALTLFITPVSAEANYDGIASGSEVTTEKGFKMVADEVLTMEGRGIVVTGKVESGVIKIGNKVHVSTGNGQTKSFRIRGIEIDRQLMDDAKTGDSVGLLL